MDTLQNALAGKGVSYVQDKLQINWLTPARLCETVGFSRVLHTKVVLLLMVSGMQITLFVVGNVVQCLMRFWW